MEISQSECNYWRRCLDNHDVISTWHFLRQVCARQLYKAAFYGNEKLRSVY